MFETKKDWLGAVVTAGVGAGVITSFAVSQGQSPITALGITVLAALLAVFVDHYMA